MQDVMASSPSSHLLRELKRLWNEPTTATCQRLSGDAENPQQGAQLDAWEDEGGASAVPGPASG
jgi:hypothetical protein